MREREFRCQLPIHLILIRSDKKSLIYFSFFFCLFALSRALSDDEREKPSFGKILACWKVSTPTNLPSLPPFIPLSRWGVLILLYIKWNFYQFSFSLLDTWKELYEQVDQVWRQKKNELGTKSYMCSRFAIRWRGFSHFLDISWHFYHVFTTLQVYP